LADIAPEFSRIYEIPAQAGAGPETLLAKKAELDGLAKRAGLPKILFLKGNFEVKQDGSGLYVLTGSLEARVIQTCVKTGEDFEDQVSDSFQTLFIAPEFYEKMDAEEIEALEDYEVLEEDKVDIGELIAQYFILSLDPYPHLKGDISEKIATSDMKVLTEQEDNKAKSPFAVLKNLKKKT